jgi:hypothetical protein
VTELVRQKAYKKTFDLACERLAHISLEEQLPRAGLSLEQDGNASRIVVPMFQEVIRLSVPGFSFESSEGRNITLTTKIVILHHIIHASGRPLSGNLIPYEDIPGCRGYAPVFDRRVSRPLLSAFGYSRDTFLEGGLSAGGKTEEFGNASFRLEAFPRIPIVFILWEGDEDFPPSLRVLFDDTIHTYLPLEDIVVVSKMAATRIMKKTRQAEYAE